MDSTPAASMPPPEHALRAAAARVEEPPTRNSQVLVDEKGNLCGYLVSIPGEPPFLTTAKGTPSSPTNDKGRLNKAHATRLRALDRLLGDLVEEAGTTTTRPSRADRRSRLGRCARGRRT